MLFCTMNKELKKYNNYFKLNKMILNLQKSCYIIFGPTIKTNNMIFDNCFIKIGDTILPRVYSTKFLGITIQCNLNWNQHILMTLNKLYKVIGIVYKARNNLNCDTKLMLYYSFFYPYLIYGNIFWGSSFKFLINKLLVAQKFFLRICFGLRKFDHTSHLFANHKILTIEEINKYVTLVFLYKVVNFNNYQFLNFFEYTSSVTRQHGLLKIARGRTVINDRNWMISGAKLWNELALNEYKSTSIKNFKYVVKSKLLNINK